MVKDGPSIGHCILVVDDEPYIRRSLFRIIRRENLSCLVAANSEDALVFLKKRRISVVVSDVVLPGGSGIDFLSEIKRSYPDIYRLCLSGRVDRTALAPAIQSGVISRFLAKPWANAEFLAALHLGLTVVERSNPVRCGAASRKALGGSVSCGLDLSQALAAGEGR